MGGIGSGRKAGSAKQDKLDPSEIIGESNGTVIGGEMPKEAPKKKKAPGMKVEEARAKLNLLFGGVCRVLKMDYPYQDEDFTAEAQALVRMSEKFSIVGHIITLFDPLFMALGLLAKFTRIRHRKEKEQPAAQAGQQTPGNVVHMGR